VTNLVPEDEDSEDVDCDKYLMHRFCLAGIVEDPADSVVSKQFSMHV
jgi:hypothetical protein